MKIKRADAALARAEAAEAEAKALRAALVDARLIIAGLADQQAMRDDWWVERDQALRAALAAGRKPCTDDHDTERSCDWCGEPSVRKRFCSRGCREAFESDRV